MEFTRTGVRVTLPELEIAEKEAAHDLAHPEVKESAEGAMKT